MTGSEQVYLALLQETLKQVAGQIQTLERQNQNLKTLTDHTANKIEGYKLQYQQLQDQIKNYTGRMQHSEKIENKLDKWDEKVDNIIAKTKDHEEKIKELQELKAQVTTRRYQRKIDRQIERQREIIMGLQSKQGLINLKQRVVMLPKYYKMQKRNQLLSQQLGKIAVAQASLQDNELLKSTLDPENSVIDRAKATFYDIRSVYYAKKVEHSNDVLTQMQSQNSNILMRGANAITLTKKATNSLRNRMNKAKDGSNLTAADMLNAKDNSTNDAKTVAATR